ncbi:vesicle transport v-SNARE protein superfamily [Aspergillus costaricaensis CBS 115574]|uniref:Vesicle transport v-SNARE protein superfamily n=1 Tax=Aspergillus costaricaensis CBS 115574 TaxID=1448317 RepID=A0ACD1IT34_9EURO|nr:vesicle transport v-SNARE protein superfamily [Aspergillus costaricaensis CBS 115574]RAK93500.1 vesicle transport v-SNARE protein superfamily [Aspergillus costaricaensis CBS 115574]
MATSTGTGWAQLRQQARSLETQTENLFHTYSQYASLTKLPPTPSEEEQRIESQLKDLLERRDSLISQLARLLDSEATLTSSALKQNNLSRHREVLHDHRRELQRLKSAISESRDRANLLSNVRSDIDAYRSSNPGQAEADYMLEERGRIDESHNMIDGVLSQAYAINENFGLQRETLASINRRIVGAANSVPGMNALIGKIGSKRRRDALILGAFIGFCFLMLLWLR